MLGNRHVLTCAHILLPAPHGEPGAAHARPARDFEVELVGRRPAVAPIRAGVVDGCWKPPQDDQRADLALLGLAEPLPEETGQVLRRLPSGARRAVRMFGFPDMVPTGVWARARLAGDGGPGGEWIQLDSEPTGPTVEPGFSGTPVFDEETDQVLGIVVSYLAGQGSALSWMIPVETIIRYLPRVREWVSGDSAVDASLAAPVGPVHSDEAVVRQLADFLAPGAPPDSRIMVTAPGSPAQAALRDVVLRTSREFRPAGPDRSGPPPAVAGESRPGRIDLALDVSGRTVAEVSSRIVNWMSVGAELEKSLADSMAGEPPPMNLVLDGVDRAADPAALVAEVVRPIAERVAGRNLRLLLTFHDHDAPSLPYAAIELLAARIAEVRAAEQAARERYVHVAARVTPVSAPGSHEPGLRLRLTALRAAAAQPGSTPLLPVVESCRRRADRALDAARRAVRDMESLLDERDRLRDRLDGYRSGVPAPLREDRELTALYRRAHEALWQGPADLTACAVLVDRYGTVIRRHTTGSTPKQDGPGLRQDGPGQDGGAVR
ncbi:trypsin-like peptidase domain-containing protein [Micromonospora sp. WMMD1102]|uniref:trypsin-like peptidase domain-containing protein n=1 Tax=Micromonospora sp. WMMD1102 TaxID=3016105 RepID=UPI00241588EA|nr:trypsin-like peptidase domain-containing protein [Micromonospora sp. WMMD1102]MDG4785691.1 trypsin-like peptidase domain-containing protein [Micromonospora sp. WMMD1102]MDG4792164.1 trypsin-like peptidase domain-containing protein [Micromonospora sp. WMMD1102]